MSKSDLKLYCLYCVIISGLVIESKTTDYVKAEHPTSVHTRETYPEKNLQ